MKVYSYPDLSREHWFLLKDKKEVTHIVRPTYHEGKLPVEIFWYAHEVKDIKKALLIHDWKALKHYAKDFKLKIITVDRPELFKVIDAFMDERNKERRKL